MTAFDVKNNWKKGSDGEYYIQAFTKDRREVWIPFEKFPKFMQEKMIEGGVPKEAWKHRSIVVPQMDF
jgi:hypothetical protein